MKEEKIKELLGNIDEGDISKILTKWAELEAVRRELNELDEYLRDKIRVFMREHRWDKYKDNNTKISVSITKIKKEIIDKKQLRILLKDSEYAQIVRYSEYERMNIVTPETKERLKQYVRKTKKI
jgi:predicted nucleotide-binding protein (sugar kinase/HSP70/actin superfamily)